MENRNQLVIYLSSNCTHIILTGPSMTLKHTEVATQAVRLDFYYVEEGVRVCVRERKKAGKINISSYQVFI